MAHAVEVTEIFSFTCSHCYNVEAQLQQLARQPTVKVIAVPLYDPRNINEVAAISAFFAAKSLGKEWVFRQNYFNAVFTMGYQAYSPSALQYTLTNSGLNTPSFYKLASSQQIINDVSKSANLAIKYGVTGTPTFIVNGVFYEGEDGLQQIFNH